MEKGQSQGQKQWIRKHGTKTMKKSLVKKDQKNNYRTLFLRCDCYSEVLVVDYDKDFSTLELSIFGLHASHKMSFLQKMRYLYQIIFHSEPFTDQIILQKQQILELKAFLNSI